MRDDASDPDVMCGVLEDQPFAFRRQSVLYDWSKKIELLVTEAALRTPTASAGVMAGQVDRLFVLLGVPNVRFGIVLLGAQLRYPAMHGFWILDDLVTSGRNGKWTIAIHARRPQTISHPVTVLGFIRRNPSRWTQHGGSRHGRSPVTSS